MAGWVSQLHACCGGGTVLSCLILCYIRNAATLLWMLLNGWLSVDWFVIQVNCGQTVGVF